MKRRTSLPVNLDERVMVTLITSFLIAISFAFWSFRRSNIEPCSPISIILPYGVHYTGETIHFKTSVDPAAHRNIIWDFGDKIKQSENGASAFHAFAKPGRYKIKITADDLCSNDTTINITQQVIVNILAPKEVFVGQPFILRDSTPSAKHWEWRYDDETVIDTVRNPTHTFLIAGNKKITLMVNGNLFGKCDVLVEDKPIPIIRNKLPGTKPPPGKKTVILDPPLKPRDDTSIAKTETIVNDPPPYVAPTEDSIRHMLYLIVDGQKNASNFHADVCNINISVMYNGHQITFQELCKQLRDIKKIKKIDDMSVKLFVNQKLRCINYMFVSVRTKTLGQKISEIFSKTKDGQITNRQLKSNN